MVKIVVLSFFMGVTLCASAMEIDSTKFSEREFKLVIDNDVFTSLIRDQYYSSGLFGYYRQVAERMKSGTKKVWSLGLSQRIYTPMLLSWDQTRKFDHPYAGAVSAHFDQQRYSEARSYFKLGLELGILGPASGTSKIHESWHSFLGLVEPEGWQYQIGNMPIINAYGSFAKSMIAKRNFDLIPETHFSVGTLFTNFRQELNFKFGNIRPLDESVQFNGVIGSKGIGNSKRLKEVYLVYAPGIESNIYNSVIEGRLIGDEDIHTENAASWIIQHKTGIAASWTQMDVQVYHYWRSPDTSDAIHHVYVGIHLNYRIK